MHPCGRGLVHTQEMKSDVEEIVEELPEDADLSTDPGHTQLISEINSLPSSAEPSVGPEAVALPTNSDIGPDPIQISSQDTQSPVQSPVPESRQSPVPEPALSPVSETVQSPVPEPVQSPVSETVLSSVSEPVQSPVSETVPSPVPESVQSSDQEMGRAESNVSPTRLGDESSMSSETSVPPEPSKREEHKYATLSRVRKFKVDGQVIETTTRKIVDVTANKTLRDNKKYQQMR